MGINNRLNIILIFLLSLFLALLSNVVLPLVMDKASYGDWRFLSSIIAFSGLTHLGIADSLYKKWLKSSTVSAEDYSIFLTSLMPISVLSCVLACIASLIIDVNPVKGLLIFLAIFFSSVSSFAYYYNSVFKNGKSLSITLFSQGIVTIFLTLCAVIYGDPGAFLLISIFVVSWIPNILTFIFSIVPIGRFKLTKIDILIEHFKIGTGIYFSNILFIVLINLDKLAGKFLINYDSAYAEYAVASSIFVAAVSLSNNVGSFMVSKNISIKGFNFRLLCFAIPVVIFFFVSEPLNHALNSIIYSYSIDYTIPVFLGIIASVCNIIYISPLKIHSPRRLSQMLFKSISIYCVTVYLGSIFSDLDFFMISFCSLICGFVYLIVSGEMVVKRSDS